MKFCEVITNFNAHDFSVLQDKINLSEVQLFTDSLIIQHKIRDLGYNINQIRKYFGYVNPTIYSIQAAAIRKTISIMESVSEVKYKDVSLVDGLKSEILAHLIFLEQVKSILDEGRNVIFLFSNTRYFYFAIPVIAREMGFEYRFGICTIAGSDLKQMDFGKVLTNKYSLADAKFRNGADNEHLISVISAIKSKCGEEPRSAFFLINNEEDFYLKPVYPVLDKFIQQEIPILISTFSPNHANQIEKRGYKVYDLSIHLDTMETEMIQKSERLVSIFFDKLKRNTNDDIVLKSYSKYLENDRTISDTFRILAVIELINLIFENFKFESVLVGADGVPENDIVCRIAEKYNVTSFSIPPAMTEYAPMYGFLYNAKKLLPSGSRLMEELVKLGINEGRLVVTGNPRYDYVRHQHSSLNGSSASKNVPSRKLIIVAMSRIHENDEEWMSELIRFCNGNNIDIVIKFHPLYKYLVDANYICEQKINKIGSNCQGMKYLISYNVDLTTLLPLSSILITEYSLVAVEASLHGKPVIVVNMDNEQFYPYSLQFHNEGIALYATSSRELFECIDKILNDAAVDERFQEARRKFNYEFNHLNDGKAADRVFQILLEPNKKNE